MLEQQLRILADSTLIKRQKWTNKIRSICERDGVITTKENIDRSKWPLARAVETYPWKNQIIRSANFMTVTSELVRPVARLYLLEEV